MGAGREPASCPASEDDRLNGMPDAQQTKKTKQNLSKDEDYQKLVQRLSERVWQLWMVELRHDQERRGQRRR